MYLGDRSFFRLDLQTAWLPPHGPSGLQARSEDDRTIKRRSRAPRYSRAPRHAAGVSPAVSVGVD